MSSSAPSSDVPPPNAPFTLTFLPDNRSVECAEAALLTDLAAAGEINIDQPYGGHGRCAKCRVRFIEGAPPPTPEDQRQLSPSMLTEGWRLACQCRIAAPAVIEIPPSERAPDAKSFGPPDLFAGQAVEPVVRIVPFSLTPSSLQSQYSALDALDKALPSDSCNALITNDLDVNSERLSASVAVLESLSPTLEKLKGQGEAAVMGNRLLAVAARVPRYGLAYDIGTTTVAGALVDLVSGKVRAALSKLNPQVRFGADVIARIHHAMKKPGGGAQLRQAVCRVVCELAERLRTQAGIGTREIIAATFCGNSAMTHFLVGADATGLGASPYVGTFTRELECSAAELQLPIHPEAGLWIFPQLRSHVGGDAMAAALAAGMDRAARPVMLIDLGTNAEIVLGCRDWMLATSTAAGPAFEGHNISHGMRAAVGAVDRVSAGPGGKLLTRVIGGNVKAHGICGSGLIDAVVALLQTGVIETNGRMLPPTEYAADRWPRMAPRLSVTPEGRRMVELVAAERSEGGRAVTLNDLDIRALQLVKGSTRAGMELLLREAGLSVAELDGIYLAGAFGNFLRKTSVLGIGLIPRMDLEKVHFLGNAAGIGARMALVDQAARRRAVDIAGRCRYIELATHPDYTDTFAEAMAFPEPGDLDTD
jgi:uncharacterized 2Fe-2S/4Fe-4S cluster protein (DUF4445 family)